MKAHLFTISSFCAVLVFALGCQKNGEDDQTAALQVSGVIKYEDGTPVADKAIQLMGDLPANVMTDSEGKFTIEEDEGLKPGEYRFFIEEMDPTSTDPDAKVYEATVTLKSGQKDLEVVLKRQK